jgi:hypothetical protein
LFLWGWPKLQPIFAGRLRRYRGVRVEDLGRAIAIDAARDSPPGVNVFEWDDVQRILR